MKRNILLTSITLIALILTTSLSAKELSQEQKSIDLLEKAFSTKQDRGVLNYINKNKYIQHNLFASDGINGLREYLDYLKGKELSNKVLISFEDKNFVVTLSISTIDKQTFKVIDIFRFENGLIVEHWDNTEEISNNDKLDTVEVKDLEKTSKNKSLVKNLTDKNILNEKYLKNHMILAQGNFVLTVNELKDDNKHLSIYELYNIENSNIKTIWNIKEAILPIDQWQNSNGKF